MPRKSSAEMATEREAIQNQTQVPTGKALARGLATRAARVALHAVQPEQPRPGKRKSEEAPERSSSTKQVRHSDHLPLRTSGTILCFGVCSGALLVDLSSVESKHCCLER